jgi:hypothetical protein
MLVYYYVDKIQLDKHMTQLRADKNSDVSSSFLASRKFTKHQTTLHGLL